VYGKKDFVRTFIIPEEREREREREREGEASPRNSVDAGR